MRTNEYDANRTMRQAPGAPRTPHRGPNVFYVALAMVLTVTIAVAAAVHLL